MNKLLLLRLFLRLPLGNAASKSVPRAGAAARLLSPRQALASLFQIAEQEATSMIAKWTEILGKVQQYKCNTMKKT